MRYWPFSQSSHCECSLWFYFDLKMSCHNEHFCSYIPMCCHFYFYGFPALGWDFYTVKFVYIERKRIWIDVSLKIERIFFSCSVGKNALSVLPAHHPELPRFYFSRWPVVKVMCSPWLIKMLKSQSNEPPSWHDWLPMGPTHFTAHVWILEHLIWTLTFVFSRSFLHMN